MIKLNLKVAPAKGRPFKNPDEKSKKSFKVYCTKKEYLEFQEYCNSIGMPVSKWFGDKMRTTLRAVKKNEQKQ